MWSNEHLNFIITQRNKGLPFHDVMKLFNKKYGEEKTASAIRQIYNKYANSEEYDGEARVVELLKSKQKESIAKTKAVRDNKALVNQHICFEQFEDTLKQLLKNNPPKLYKPVAVKRSATAKRTLFMHLSDMHFHAMIDAEEMGGLNKYTNIEEARRLAFFVKEIANYKLDHRKHTDLVIALNGDEIQGVIHDVESTPAITTQVSAAIHLLSQGISYLASQFNNVRVICTTGNHERMMHKSNKGRQTRQKWDSFGTLVHVGLKYALRQHKNVTVEIPTTPYAYVDIMGHKFFITHSDTVLSVGYPGKNINVEAAKNKINQLREGVGHIDVVVVGHVHVNTKQILNNGIVLLTNGSMSGLDEFALSIGLTYNDPTQQMFEITEKYAVGDFRAVRLLEADKDKSLDKLIEPFQGKF